MVPDSAQELTHHSTGQRIGARYLEVIRPLAARSQRDRTLHRLHTQPHTAPLPRAPLPSLPPSLPPDLCSAHATSVRTPSTYPFWYPHLTSPPYPYLPLSSSRSKNHRYPHIPPEVPLSPHTPHARAVLHMPYARTVLHTPYARAVPGIR
eukprot:2814403-Rhodomonas_salina.1